MANRRDYYYRQKVTEAELDAGFQGLEDADRNLSTDNALVGVITNLVVTEHGAGVNLTVDVTGQGAAYDVIGQRIYVPSLQTVDLSQDFNAVTTAVTGVGNEKQIAVFVKFNRSLSDPRIDGNSSNVYFQRDESFAFYVKQGAESGIGTSSPATLDSDKVLLCDVTRAYGQSTFVNANISTARRQDSIVVAGSPHALRRGRLVTAVADILGFFNAHVTGGGDNHAATAINYAGGPAWADTTTNPSATVEAQLDKVVGDLAATTGDVKVGAPTRTQSPTSLASGSIGTQIVAFLTAFNAFQNQKSAASGLAALDGSTKLTILQRVGWFVVDAIYTNDTWNSVLGATTSATFVDGSATVSLAGCKTGDVIEIASQIQGSTADVAGMEAQVVANSNGGGFGLVAGTRYQIVDVNPQSWVAVGRYVCTADGTVVVKHQLRSITGGGGNLSSLSGSGSLRAIAFRP